MLFHRIDDLDNELCQRRGKPLAHTIFGTACTMNAANYGYFLALEMANQLGHANVCRFE